ncbi:MAG: hypothetical protein IJY66_02325, partial [Clostridia bacterium]|nr:hypothetical protein [Clostridia bacterium]
MALEATILTPQRIRYLLHAHYGMDCTLAERLPLGTANCYRVTVGDQSYFLKEFQSSISEEDVRREVGVV